MKSDPWLLSSQSHRIRASSGSGRRVAFVRHILRKGNKEAPVIHARGPPRCKIQKINKNTAARATKSACYFGKSVIETAMEIGICTAREQCHVKRFHCLHFHDPKAAHQEIRIRPPLHSNEPSVQVLYCVEEYSYPFAGALPTQYYGRNTAWNCALRCVVKIKKKGDGGRK